MQFHVFRSLAGIDLEVTAGLAVDVGHPDLDTLVMDDLAKCLVRHALALDPMDGAADRVIEIAVEADFRLFGARQHELQPRRCLHP